MQLTIAEMTILNTLAKEKWNTVALDVERKSEREFDLIVKGQDSNLNCAFSAWLVLAAIRELTAWTSKQVAGMTDHPEMSMSGDWSGVRDTDESKLWEILYTHVVPKVTENVNA